jgi:hypothetical protein
MTADDRNYYLKRAADEDEAARTAFSLAARWRHEELANLYRMRVVTLDGSVHKDEGGIVQPFILVASPTQTEAA